MPRHLPATQSLLCFEAAARHGSYTRAARELALTQSAVSRQVIALEEYLGHALFQRTRHGMVLTPRGRAYAEQVRETLLSLERSTHDAMSSQATQTAVQLATVPTFATRWLMPRLSLLAVRHPDIVVHMETRTRAFLFADTSFDLALFAGTQEQVDSWAGTQATRLMDEVVVPVCSPQLLATYPVPDASALAQLPLLQQSTRPSAWKHWFEANTVHAPQALAGARYELFSMAVAAAACGLGVALVPWLLVQAEVARGELVLAYPATVASGRAYWLVRPERLETRPAVHHFGQWLLAMAAASAAPTGKP